MGICVDSAGNALPIQIDRGTQSSKPCPSGSNVDVGALLSQGTVSRKSESSAVPPDQTDTPEAKKLHKKPFSPPKSVLDGVDLNAGSLDLGISSFESPVVTPGALISKADADARAAVAAKAEEAKSQALKDKALQSTAGAGVSAAKSNPFDSAKVDATVKPGEAPKINQSYKGVASPCTGNCVDPLDNGMRTFTRTVGGATITQEVNIYAGIEAEAKTMTVTTDPSPSELAKRAKAHKTHK